MQQSRRHNPYPFTWEIPVATACAVLLALVLGVHAGRGLANLSAGGGWQWPDPTALFRSAPAVITGDATAGLTTTTLTADAASLAVWLVVTEVLVIVVLAFVASFIVRRWGPGRLKGMASREEAEKLLGVSRLRRVRHLVRPDLHTQQGRTIGGKP